MSKLEQFCNARTRFQRVDDARLFSGWVRGLNTKSLVVQIRESSALSPGQDFLFHIYGDEATMVVPARLQVANGKMFAFSITGSIQTEPANEARRLKVDDVAAQIVSYSALLSEGLQDSGQAMAYGTGMHQVGEGHVVDVSRRGFGIVTERSYSRDERICVVIETPWGETECLVKVRYCKAVANGFRLGVEVIGMDRVNGARYSRLLQTAASAA